jgi:hypothetical protein
VVGHLEAHKHVTWGSTSCCCCCVLVHSQKGHVTATVSQQLQKVFASSLQL